MGLLATHPNTRIRRALILVLAVVSGSLFYRQLSPSSTLPLPLVLPDYATTHGHLYYTPQHPIHPIHQLIQTNKRKWDRKLKSQSKSLHEAVEEYERRYTMRPPKGMPQSQRMKSDIDFSNLKVSRTGTGSPKVTALH